MNPTAHEMSHFKKDVRAWGEGKSRPGSDRGRGGPGKERSRRRQSFGGPASSARVAPNTSEEPAKEGGGQNGMAGSSKKIKNKNRRLTF